jgi:5'-methylthioadenosine/S-adenosylhomocysteine nucleosidase
MSRHNHIIGIIGSMDAEIEQYTQQATYCQTTQWNDFLFHKVQLFSKDVVIIKSGVGKVCAAMVCERLIDAYHPRAIIFTGVAGALNPDLEIGDVVVSRDCMQHDLDVQALGFARGTIPYTQYRVFVASEKLRKLALAAQLRGNKIVEGRILTGDQFLTQKEASDHTYLVEELKGDVIEMEGGAIAQVCTLTKTPFLIVRTVSDKADSTAGADFHKFLPIVANNSFTIIETILNNL